MCRWFLRRGFVGLGFSKIRVLSFFSLCIYKKFYTLQFHRQVSFFGGIFFLKKNMGVLLCVEEFKWLT